MGKETNKQKTNLSECHTAGKQRWQTKCKELKMLGVFMGNQELLQVSRNLIDMTKKCYAVIVW